MQYEVLDLINCLITPIFFANMLSRWPKSFVTTVYCVVLTLKGYQLTLLLIPAARQRHAHAKARSGPVLCVFWSVWLCLLAAQHAAAAVNSRPAPKQTTFLRVQ